MILILININQFFFNTISYDTFMHFIETIGIQSSGNQ